MIKEKRKYRDRLQIIADRVSKKSRYRDRFQIIADILSITSKGAMRTRIMYQANLSWKLLNKYLDEVLAAGLVDEDDDCYMTTQKGKVFLEEHESYSEKKVELEEKMEEFSVEGKKLEKMSRPLK